MEFLELKDISERYMELINPTSTEKILKVGKVLNLKEEKRIIDFGCGFGETLVLWAENFGISGVGIDIREYACERARKKIKERGLSEQIEIICGDASKYPFEKNSFDVASCIGATFIWGGYRDTIRAMKEAINREGKLVIGEAYWKKSQVPPEYAISEKFHTEFELLQIAKEEGFDFEYVIRASDDDWDRYEADNWYGLIRWIEENPEHPELEEVIKHLHKSQDEYTKYEREYLGWAIYILNPVKYVLSLEENNGIR